MSEARAEKAKREADKLRSNLKTRANKESYFVRNMAPGRHHRRGGGVGLNRHGSGRGGGVAGIL